ncbi:hypothetical protein Tco_0728197 [Tanacetum coccineum]|uniref:Uncharacterized protein n=1 Tax=Tanacetum coccineum TaxID=301880 RepID=A0ABQ4YMS8_9ASTR
MGIMRLRNGAISGTKLTQSRNTGSITFCAVKKLSCVVWTPIERQSWTSVALHTLPILPQSQKGLCIIRVILVFYDVGKSCLSHLSTTHVRLTCAILFESNLVTTGKETMVRIYKNNIVPRNGSKITGQSSGNSKNGMSMSSPDVASPQDGKIYIDGIRVVPLVVYLEFKHKYVKYMFKNKFKPEVNDHYNIFKRDKDKSVRATV